MKKLVCYLLISVFFPISVFSFDKVIIWGHKLHSHTHSYIHNAYYRAFKYLGYPTYWFDNSDNVSNFDFSNALFLTEGQVDQKIPLRRDCKYILHNCTSNKYNRLKRNNQILTLQVYTHDVLARPKFKKISPCTYFYKEGKNLVMPWATDLLPHEIDANKYLVSNTPKRPYITWVGTIGDGKFGNNSELMPFIKEAKKADYVFKAFSNISMKENRDEVMIAALAPAIVGKWQKKQGYIPCRIFKNISYGNLGVTNSAAVQELFEGRLIYDPDPVKLFYKAHNAYKTYPKEKLFALMDYVRDNHTYINRISVLLDCLSIVTD